MIEKRGNERKALIASIGVGKDHLSLFFQLRLTFPADQSREGNQQLCHQ